MKNFSLVIVIAVSLIVVLVGFQSKVKNLNDKRKSLIIHICLIVVVLIMVFLLGYQIGFDVSERNKRQNSHQLAEVIPQNNENSEISKSAEKNGECVW